ncbi:hypothetical protein E4U21_005618 [Claviceps maximensis]|nr:hypothetical protein E4U21_005618 [Claviceps maximensis]
MEHCSSEDDQELSQDEIKTLGMAGSCVCSINAVEPDPPPLRPAITHSSARALNSEQAKRNRARRNLLGAVTLQERTPLESIDESSEDKPTIAAIQSCHPLSALITCPCCGNVCPGQLDLDHHIEALHIGPRPDGPRVVHADDVPSEDVRELLGLTGGKSLGDFFRPPTLGNAAQNDSIIGGWRAAALPVIHDEDNERMTVPKSSQSLSVFTIKLEEHHGPPIGPQISASEIQPGPSTTIVSEKNETINSAGISEQREDRLAKKDAGDDENGHRNSKIEADDADDNDAYGSRGEYRGSVPANSAESGKKFASPRVPPLSWFNKSSRQSCVPATLPSIDSVLSNTATIDGEILPRLKPAVVRQPLTDDEDDSSS